MRIRMDLIKVWMVNHLQEKYFRQRPSLSMDTKSDTL